LGNVQSASTHLSFSGIPDEDEDAGGDYGDGRATLQAQVRALQADLQDKTRYISTLERRLLQARRSSHSRVSMAFNKSPGDDGEVLRKLDEKDAMIADLQKTVSALRSAVRKRDIAELTPEMSSSEFKQHRNQEGHQSTNSNTSSQLGSISIPSQQGSNGPRSPLTTSPMTLLSPQKPVDKKKKTVDEMSKMLDEMIRDKVENGKLTKGRSASARVPSRSSSQRHSRRTSSASFTGGPAMGTLVASLRERDSVVEVTGPI
jgi:centromeric protein E